MSVVPPHPSRAGPQINTIFFSPVLPAAVPPRCHHHPPVPAIASCAIVPFPHVRRAAAPVTCRRRNPCHHLPQHVCHGHRLPPSPPFIGLCACPDAGPSPPSPLLLPRPLHCATCACEVTVCRRLSTLPCAIRGATRRSICHYPPGLYPCPMACRRCSSPTRAAQSLCRLTNLSSAASIAFMPIVPTTCSAACHHHLPQPIHLCRRSADPPCPCHRCFQPRCPPPPSPPPLASAIISDAHHHRPLPVRRPASSHGLLPSSPPWLPSTRAV